MGGGEEPGNRERSRQGPCSPLPESLVDSNFCRARVRRDSSALRTRTRTRTRTTPAPEKCKEAPDHATASESSTHLSPASQSHRRRREGHVCLRRLWQRSPVTLALVDQPDAGRQAHRGQNGRHHVLCRPPPTSSYRIASAYAAPAAAIPPAGFMIGSRGPQTPPSAMPRWHRVQIALDGYSKVPCRQTCAHSACHQRHSTLPLWPRLDQDTGSSQTPPHLVWTGRRSHTFARSVPTTRGFNPQPSALNSTLHRRLLLNLPAVFVHFMLI
ncbi:hypothetical protein AK830_g11911 [Neonectria ditissima]|uniref:Uncharacterized protein n=1 Tax=Neonectria ditissima TaxID=78410 RepID=A0A0P7AQF2_9HYPO|nr:hypothetical protein AK830_g11911 [Neonectria ditissima]